MSKIALKTIKLGDSADTSKNFLISVPAVPDGTLTIERENGTDVLTVGASGKVTMTPTDAMLPLGVGQSWVDQIAGKAVGVSYTNNTGRTIAVAIRVSVSAINGVAFLTIDGRNIATYQAYGASTTGSLFGLVPPGKTYSVNQANATVGLVYWEELR